MERKKLEDIAGRILTLKDGQFNMSGWWAEDRTTYFETFANADDWCGTAGCIAGWACHFEGNVKLGNQTHRAEDRATEILGLDLLQSRMLFMPVYDWGCSLPEITKEQAVNELLYLAQSNDDLALPRWLDYRPEKSMAWPKDELPGQDLRLKEHYDYLMSLR